MHRLVVAGGSAHSYSGHDEGAEHAPESKSLTGALQLRSGILSAFEPAESEEDQACAARGLTFVIVGGGPTGRRDGRVDRSNWPGTRPIATIGRSKTREREGVARGDDPPARRRPRIRCASRREGRSRRWARRRCSAARGLGVDAESVAARASNGATSRTPTRTAAWARRCHCLAARRSTRAPPARLTAPDASSSSRT